MQLMMMRDALMTFIIANDVGQYFAIDFLIVLVGILSNLWRMIRI
ncbi:MAG: hypothetical protein ONB44_08515 [candidate division KSB1 bacterium]|nr:hypothetical protein [candidate division KSB1 bacterium]MDZ7302172.1 hypothetical protein [candidate division KSB1 bacterium]MDZ7311281.1 hypothetical protein [candidate division KSB1 bacterium]